MAPNRDSARESLYLYQDHALRAVDPDLRRRILTRMAHSSGIADIVTLLVDTEIAGFVIDTTGAQMLLDEFRALRVTPKPITVNFSGGITQTCWITTRSNGAYCVVYLPTAGYFSLCADSDFGPLDIGVHGPAIQCFSAV